MLKRLVPHLLVLGAYALLWSVVHFDALQDPQAVVRFLDRALGRSLVAFEEPPLWIAAVLLGLLLPRLLPLALAGAGAAIGLYTARQSYGSLSGLTAARLTGDIITALVVGYAVNAAATLRSGH